MNLMHTKLPEFLKKMKLAAASKGAHPKEIKIEGLENLKYAKMQSLRTGRIELAVEELSQNGNIEQLEMIVMPRIPETMHTIVIKGIDKNGLPVRAILETINIINCTEEVELIGFSDIEDRRPKLGLH